CGLIYGWFWWRDQQQIARIEELRQMDIARDKKWNQKLATAIAGENLATFSGQTSGVSDVAISIDGKYIASVANDNSTKVWRLNDGILLQPPYFDYSSALLTVAISPDDKILAHGSLNKINFYNFLTGEPRTAVPTIDAHLDWITSIVFSKDGKYIFSASNDKSVKMWDANDGSLKQTFAGHNGAVMTIAISSDGRFLVSGSADSSVRVWNTNDGTVKHILKGQESILTSVVISADGKIVSSGGENGKTLFWDNATGKVISSMMISSNGITSQTISSDNAEMIYGSSDGEVVLWNLSVANSQPTRWKLHQGSVTSVAISGNNTMIISAGGDGDNKVIVTKYK
ncbi:MAG: WD40 repeat domain-containing protein, partial [Bacteroidota bacterium]